MTGPTTMDVDAGGAGGGPATTAAAAAAGPKDGYELPWVEKYRPHTLADVVGNVDAIDRLRVIETEGGMPNLILAGPPGTGKTTAVLALARALLGPAARDAVLELNASDDRGIDVVRNKIKMFAQRRVTLPPGRHKVVILDEADAMTGGAQQALRRTMELHSATTRFALACNTSAKVIEPIQSRCAVLRFGRLTDAEVLARLQKVAAAERVATTADGLEALIFSADGDMRQALNNLQSTSAGFGVVNREAVLKVCDQPHPLVLVAALTACAGGDLDEASRLVGGLWDAGYAASDIIGTFFRVVRNAKPEVLPEFVQLEFVRAVGGAHARAVEGVGSRLQVVAMLARMCAVAEDAMAKNQLAAPVGRGGDGGGGAVAVA